MKIKKEKRNYLIVGLCAILVIMAVGYAAFASQLTINSAAETTSTWNIRITNIKGVNDASITNNGAYDMKINEQDAEVGPKIENNGLEAYFKTGLVSPSDARIYEVEVTNLGSLDATVTPTLTGSTNPAIITRYDGVSSDTTGVNATILTNAGVYTKTSLNTGNTFDLDAGKKKYLYVYVQYNPAVESQPENLTASAQLVLNAVQKGSNSGSEEEPTGNIYYLVEDGTNRMGGEFDTTGKNANEWPNGRKAALKYVLDDENKIVEAYACAKFEGLAEPICFKGGSVWDNNKNDWQDPSPYFEFNENIMSTIKNDFETKAGGTCTYTESDELGTLECSVGEVQYGGTYIKVTAYSDGSVVASSSAQDASEECYFRWNDDLYCNY